MCQDIFWPGKSIQHSLSNPDCVKVFVKEVAIHFFYLTGIDLSECLQYPDFSVVVLYKKVVVGFGFMVPDVKYNEAYISFLLVHPEWRRAGIATFMIYHLIQVRQRE